ncbi:acyltransferase family protein [Georgenia ruanii]
MKVPPSPSPRHAAGRRRLATGAGTGTGTGHFRPEIQGLRSLAVLMVVVYHVFLDRVSGGVDVFLMISAFLLTLSFVRKVEGGRPLGLAGHWLHRFKRLLPAAAVTILGTLVAVGVLLPSSRWTAVIEQAWASLLYWQNWLLAAASVDYYARDDSLASPLQHFWSLSIQGQVFILWPLIFAAGAWLSRRLGWRYRTVLAVAFGAVFAGSLAFSVHETATNQAFAYFDTRARLWEFAAGSLLALALPYLRPARALRVVLGWTGVLAMLACGLVLPVGQAFPGAVALWPLLAAALVIVAGQTGAQVGADRVLSARPLVGLGNVSYALYLVHWPILTVYLATTDQARAGLGAGLAIIAASIGAAYLVTYLVETPLRRATWTEAAWWRMGTVVAACLLVVATPVAAWQLNIDRAARAAASGVSADNPGALALRPGYEAVGDPDAPTLPLATQLDLQWASLDHPCEGDLATADPLLELCRQTTPLTAPDKVVVLVGDSHAEQWLEALEPVAAQQNWQLVALLKGGCAFGEPTAPGQNPDCLDWLHAAKQYVLDVHPDAIFTVATAASPTGPDERLVTGYRDLVTEMTGLGIDVLGVRDNPRFAVDMYECVEQRGADPCEVDLDRALAPVSPAEALSGIPGFFPVDLTDRLCPGTACPPVIGNVYVYLDDNHLTADYAATLATDLRERLLAVTGW